MKSNRILVSAMAALVLFAGTVFSQSQADKLYEEGRVALSEERWSEAIEKFEQAAAEGGSRADASLYWKAYAQERQGLQTETLETIGELKRARPNSRWINDANALELKVRRAAGLPVEPDEQPDEDLKLIAINSLMHSDPERAVPLLEKILKTNPSERLRKKALFVLAQSDSAKAREITESIARDGSNRELQKTAIQHLGVFGGPENRALLSEIYASSNDVEVKKRVLQSFMVSGEKQRVLAAAESEKDPELRRKAVQLLGVMGAREDLWRMYQGETDTEIKKRIINALFVASDHERMGMLAKSEKNSDLRAEAVEKLGLMGQKTAPTLTGLYADSDPEVRKAVLKAFFLQSNAKALIDIARKETDRDLKKRAVRHLSIMGSKEANDFMLEILNQ